jgi:hypothetical protein
MALGDARFDIHNQDPDLQPIAEADEWEPVASEVSVAPHLAAIVSIRLDPDAARLVRRAARAARLTQAEFVRQAALKAAETALAS